jgi:S1-C subfamily serine protease
MRRFFWPAGLVLAAMAACAPIPAERVSPTAATPFGSTDHSDSVYWGTGFFVDRSGHILTAHHIVRDCARIEVASGDRREPAALIAASAEDDLSLLRIPEPFGAPLAFASETATQSGGLVAVLGYAALGAEDTRLAFNSLVIAAAAARRIALISDAAPGYSGSPVVARDGRVIGVLQAKVTRSRVPLAPAGPSEIRLAVSAATAVQFLHAQSILPAEGDAVTEPLLTRLIAAEVKVECHGPVVTPAQLASQAP